ncbi:MAG: DUF4988 and DUF4465 domain-containing protein [Odoribacteraceae bacterium]|jgi:hypothetical protein|nr:DUF4988 and DUF4465 domain-containing protein [Odoribacteraceae bacterium]
MKKYLSILIIPALLVACYDDSRLWNSVNDLEEKMQTLEEQVARANEDVAALQSIVNALNAGKTITAVDSSATGYAISFSDRSSLTLRHGKDGADAPLVGVKEDAGVYYWTITSGASETWITTTAGDRLPVSGKDGATPTVSIDAEGYWTVNGSRVSTLKAAGEKGDPGDSFFTSVVQDDLSVTFTLANGVSITLPKTIPVTIASSLPDHIWIRQGETLEGPVDVPSTASIVITKPDGWKVALRDGKLSITAPPLANAFAEKDGIVSITAIGEQSTANRSFSVSARDYSTLIDFEDARVADYLAGPTSYGENLYDGHAEQYVGYDDPSGLFMMINESYGAYNFYNGGIAISQWNDTIAGDYSNQCSVYSRDPLTGFGGYLGSRTFAVHAGYSDASSWSDARSYITFGDDATTRTFDHVYIANTTYAVKVMKNGNAFATPLTYANAGYLKIIIEGIAPGGSITNTIECYLADFRAPSSPGILTSWTPVDLTPLGEVTSLRFNIQGSDVGTSGLNTPAYFAFDNLAIK